MLQVVSFVRLVFPGFPSSLRDPGLGQAEVGDFHRVEDQGPFSSAKATLMVEG